MKKGQIILDLAQLYQLFYKSYLMLCIWLDQNLHGL